MCDECKRANACINCGKEFTYLVFGTTCVMCRRFERKHGRLPDKTERHHKTTGWKRCKRCKKERAYCKGRCVACYDYWRRKGKERPKDRFTDECLNCGKPLNRDDPELSLCHGKGMCQPCYQYQWMYGVPRPERMWNRGKYGYCDCGAPATHKAQVQVHRHQEEMPLCDDCHAEYQRQVAWYGDGKPSGNLQQGKTLYGDD